MTKIPGLCLLFAPALMLSGQTASFHEENLHGRRAFVLENDLMRVATLPGGGYIGEIRLKSGDPRKSVNPMRVPHYQTIDPFTYDQARHGALYGTGSQRLVMAGYMGHYLCFPHFGPSSAAELALGLGAHGEAIGVEWKQQEVNRGNFGVMLRYAAELPITRYRVERVIALPADETVGYVEETVENLAQYDRPVQWVQHVTFGPPFVAVGKNRVDAPVAKVALGGLRRGESIAEGSWPVVPDPQGGTSDLRAFSGNTSVWMLDRERSNVYFTMFNAEYRILIGYIFEGPPNRWVLDWQENQRAKQTPWDGKVIARGICIGDSPVQGIRNAIERGNIFSVPVYSWIQARQRRAQKYLFFLAEIPVGFKGVADLRTEGGRITIVERETGKLISIKSAHSW